MTDVDATFAPPGYRARLQTIPEKVQLGLSSCDGCVFEHESAGGTYGCRERPCSKFERPDKQTVVFERIT